MARVEPRARSGLVRALVLSVAAAAVPVAGVFLFPDSLRDYEALTWLLLLIPAFLLAYERGWRGVATALAFGMAALSVTYAVSQSLGGTLPDLLLAVTVVYIAVSLGIGAFGEKVASEQYRAAAETLALQDPLTGLANRRRVELHLDLQFATAERGLPLAVVLFDVDRLSAWNLRHGRAAGDGVLKGFASLLRRHTRRMDIAARYGPDEFLVVLTGATEEGAVVFAARLQEQIRAAEQTVSLPTVSVGVACYRPDIEGPDALIRAAQHALHEARENGGDRVRIHGRRIEDLALPERTNDGDATAPAAARGPDGPPDGEREAELLGTGRFALVLTPDAIARTRVSQILRRHGFDVMQAAEPRQIAESLQHECDVAFVDLGSGAAAVADLLRDLRFRSPAMRVIGLSPPDQTSVDTDLLRVRLDGHYLLADEEESLVRQLDELLREHDELAEAHLRQHQLSHELRARDRELRTALAASEARYRTLLESISDVVFVTDAEGQWLSLNAAWAALTGFAVERTLGSSLFDAIHDDDAALVRSHFAQVLAGAPFWRHEVRLRTRDGHGCAVEIRLEPMHAAEHRPAGVQGMITRIPEPARAGL